MNIINSIIGIVMLAVLIAIGYKVAQIVIELNSPIIPKTDTTEITVIEEPSSSSTRWNHFPLTVYINDEFIKQKNPEYADDARQALDIWQDTRLVSFSIVNNPKADVTIKWVTSLKEKSLDTLGNTEIKLINVSKFGIMQNATIELLAKSESRELSSNDMVNLALHEIGHALGLQHTNKDDIMNPVLIIPSKNIISVSPNDISNLLELYKDPVKPDLKIIGINATKSTFTRLGQNYFYLNISIDVQNAGLSNAENFNMQFAADNLVVNEGTQSMLEPGNILSIFQGNLKIDRNFTSVQVSIDPENKIDELNETNNFIDIPV